MKVNIYYLLTEFAFRTEDIKTKVLKYGPSLRGQEMREGQPSLKGFCDLGLKLESCWVAHLQDDVDRFLHL